MSRYIPTPGEILLEEFMKPLEISNYRLAKDTKMTSTHIGQIINGKRRITPETALRLSAYFGNSAEFWINLQSYYDLEIVKEEKGKIIKSEVVSSIMK
jgi:antitoxin HigA-1